MQDIKIKNYKRLILSVFIGTSLISGEEMIENSKGKAIENLHYVGDTIWDLKI